VRCPKVNSTEALVDVAESLLEQHGYVKNREVIAIVAGTRTKSGSTNFLRLHVLGEHTQEGVRFFAPHHQETLPDPAEAQPKPKRAPRKAPALSRYPSPNPPKISNP
jgi:pyruvate kinase